MKNKMVMLMIIITIIMTLTGCTDTGRKVDFEVDNQTSFESER